MSGALGAGVSVARLIWRAIASPNLALALLGLLALAALAGGTLPQSWRLSPQELNAWQGAWPLLSLWLDRLGLSDVYATEWFLGLCLALVVNLLAGVIAHVARIRAWLKAEMLPSHSLSGCDASSAYSFGALSLPDSGSGSAYRGAWGLAGLPLFHAGIALIVLAALANTSQRMGAHLELAEGEAFTGAKGKLLAERGSREPEGDLGFRLRLDGLRVEIEGGGLQELQARLSIQQQNGALRQEILEVNHPIRIGHYQLYLDKTMGSTAVFERILPDGKRRRLLVNFIVPSDDWGQNKPLLRDETLMLDDRPIYFRMALTPGDAPSFRLVAERRGQAVFDGTLLPGQKADLGVYQLVFLGTSPWVGLYLTSDSAVKVVFAGFVIALAGFALHLLINPRRIRLRRKGNEWVLEAWAMRDDWRFERQWREWEAATGQQKDAP